MADSSYPGKLSLYQPASPLERGSLVQGRLQVTSPLGSPLVPDGQSVTLEDTLASARVAPPTSHAPPSSEHTHSLSLSDCGEAPPIATPTTTTEVWAGDLPAVQVVRHTSPRELPQSAGDSRFSSNFVVFQTQQEWNSPHHPDTERGEQGGGGGGEGGGRCKVGDVGVVRSASDHRVTSNLSTLRERDVSLHSKSADLNHVSENNSSKTQKKKPKGKGREVASRYMSSVKATPSVKTTPSVSKTHSTKHSTSNSTLNKSQIPKKTFKSTQKPSKKDGSFKTPSLAPVKSHPPISSLSSASLLQHPFTPSSVTSSTPKVCASSQRTQAGNHPGMDLSYITSSSKTSAATTNKSKVLISSVRSNLELELLYYRLLQATYLDVKSAKSLREQEEAAKAQLHEVWEEVEKKRRECEVLRRELETAQRNAALSSVLDVQVKDLSPIVNVLPQLQQHHTALSHALDATRHELATSGVLPATEQQLEAELLRSERLLANIVTVIRHKVPTVVSFANSTEAAVNTLDKEFQELEKCWKELSTAMRLQVQETSLTFEKKQRQRHMCTPSLHHTITTQL